MKKSKSVFWFKRYFVDSLNAMAMGLFASLIIGLILKTLGNFLALPSLVYCGEIAQRTLGACVAVAIAFVFEAPLLVLLSSAVVGMLAFPTGGLLGILIAVLCAVEVGKYVSGKTALDIFVSPLLTLLVGFFVGKIVGLPIQKAMHSIREWIDYLTQIQPFFMSIFLAISMGLLLTLPVSSAAVAIAISLEGLAGGAATIGCVAQMIGFAVMSIRDNRWGIVLSLGLGTSMLQMPNIIKNPFVLLPPILTSAILSPIAILLFEMKNTPYGSGMGTSGLVGQIGTYEAMGQSSFSILLIIIFHLLAPAFLSWLLYQLFYKLDFIQKGDLKIKLK